MSQRFTDAIILITGGSTGIGLATAKRFLAEGAKRVYITGRSDNSLKAAVEALGDRAVAVISDVSILSDLERLKTQIEARGDQLDVVFANAGIAENNRFADTTEAEFDKTFDINVKGVFFTVQTMLPLLKDGGSVILTASIVANKGMKDLSLYSASKAAVRSLARSMANELKDRKIRVNAVSPGYTRTPIFENGLKLSENQIAAFYTHAKDAVPLGYIAQPDEIASAVLFLASSEASYTNGIELTVDGGLTQV